MYAQAITPAVKSHLDAQFSFLSDITNKMCATFRSLNDLQIDYFQNSVDEMTDAGRQMLTAQDTAQWTSVTASQVQAAAERWREYEQRLVSLLANAQRDLSKTAETHVPETSRTAAAVADEIVRKTSEETEKASQAQKSAVEKMAAPYQRGDGAGKGTGGTPNATSTTRQ